jgi:glyoxylase-like metal-dependent hydrolase (beta-lactamase superfamily II)
MKLEQVSTSVYRIGMGFVNAYVIQGSADVTLVDTGMPGSASAIFAALEEIGRGPGDVGRIILTHLHYDHTGSVTELRKHLSAPMVMHPTDAELLRQGRVARDFNPAPRFWARLMSAGMRGIPRTIDPIEVQEEVADGQVLSDVADARVIHVPGHAAGQIALLVPEDGGVLIAADAASNFFRLDYPPIFEELERGRESLRRLAAESFETACFGHGRVIRKGASAAFQRRFA